MKYNTRFCPTINNLLHLGHLYIAKVNETEAHKTGSKFFVRFDDDQFYWNDIAKIDIDTIKNETKKDFEWAGIEVDEYISEKEINNSVDELLNKFKYKKFNTLSHGLTHIYLPETPASLNAGRLPDEAIADKSFYPFVPDLTARKVICDALNDTRLLIRGLDLITEFSLYNYYCMAWDLIIPKQVFLPKVKMLENSGQISGISKTLGGFAIKTFRDRGVSAKEIWHMMADSCLLNPNEPWTINNIKPNPYIEKNKYKNIFEPSLSENYISSAEIIDDNQLKTSEKIKHAVGYGGASREDVNKSKTNLWSFT